MLIPYAPTSVPKISTTPTLIASTSPSHGASQPPPSHFPRPSRPMSAASQRQQVQANKATPQGRPENRNTSTRCLQNALTLCARVSPRSLSWTSRFLLAEELFGDCLEQREARLAACPPRPRCPSPGCIPITKLTHDTDGIVNTDTTLPNQLSTTYRKQIATKQLQKS